MPAERINPDEVEVESINPDEVEVTLTGVRRAPSPSLQELQQQASDVGTGLLSTPARLGLTLSRLGQAAGFRGPPSPTLEQAAQIPESAGGHLGAFGGDVAASFMVPGAGWPGLAAQTTLGAALNPSSPGTGAAFGAAGPVLGKLAGGLVTPSAEVAALRAYGIQPSVGQAAGGLANAAEQRAGSYVAGVAGARARPLQEFGEAAVRRATRGQAQTLDEANAYANRLYEDVVPSLKPTREAVRGIQRSVGQALQNPELTTEARDALVRLVQSKFASFGQMDGPAIKTLDAELGHVARKYASGSPMEQAFADELYNIQTAFREGLEFGLPPELQGKLKLANVTWRDLVPINRAASQRADELITPRALQRALARQQNTEPSRLQDPLIDPALRVLPQTIRDSGTPSGVAFGAQTLAGLMDPSATGLALAAGQGAGLLGSTRPVQKFLTGGYEFQNALAKALRRVLTPAGAQQSEL